MSTRFYAGPINIGMGRRWDDKFEPEAGTVSPPRRVRALPLRATPPVAPPPASSTTPLPVRLDPLAPRR